MANLYAIQMTELMLRNSDMVGFCERIRDNENLPGWLRNEAEELLENRPCCGDRIINEDVMRERSE